MKISIVQPKEAIDLVAGMIGLLFDRFDGELTTNGEAANAQVAVTQPEADDLTKINGIGPAFARRLAEAGVTTYGQLAKMTAEEVRQKAQLAEWQGDPEEWISQATALTEN